MEGDKLMFNIIKTTLTIGILWIVIAFTWVPLTTAVEKTQLVNKTKQSVHNIYTGITGKVKKHYEK
jgi:hypothetical protein|tara:strand:- start:214 stop:411 length:198 start_codon:yes stop_codon:yes gene_type:complete